MVLIGYKTKSGTTKEAAEVIKKVFVEHNYSVELIELSEVTSIEKYDTIIIGAPINGMQWLPEATKFLKNNEQSLKGKNTACFALSYIIKDGRKFWKKRIRRSFKKNSDLINPIGTKIFGGKVDKPMPGFARLIFGLSIKNPLNYTDEEKIKEWAKKIVMSLE